MDKTMVARELAAVAGMLSAGDVGKNVQFSADSFQMPFDVPGDREYKYKGKVVGQRGKALTVKLTAPAWAKGKEMKLDRGEETLRIGRDMTAVMQLTTRNVRRGLVIRNKAHTAWGTWSVKDVRNGTWEIAGERGRRTLDEGEFGEWEVVGGTAATGMVAAALEVDIDVTDERKAAKELEALGAKIKKVGRGKLLFSVPPAARAKVKKWMNKAGYGKGSDYPEMYPALYASEGSMDNAKRPAVPAVPVTAGEGGMRRTAGFQRHLEEKMEALGFKPLQYDLEMGSRPMMRMTERLGPSEMKDLADRLRPDFNAKVMGDTLFFRPVENLWGRTSSDRTAASDVGRDVYEALDDVENALSDAVAAAKDAERKARAIGGEMSRVVGGQLELYLQRHLESFISNQNQPGSVASLRRFIEGWEEEEAEMAREGSSRTASLRPGDVVKLLKGGKTSKAVFADGEEMRVTEVQTKSPWRIRLTGAPGDLSVPMESAWKYLRGFSRPPSLPAMEKWMEDGAAKAVDGSRVEPDGVSASGYPSWLLVLGMI